MKDTDQELLKEVDDGYYTKLYEALKRLQDNPDFKLVIEQGYLKDKAIAGVNMLSMPHIKKQGIRPDVMEELISISNLREYFFTIEQFARAVMQDKE